MKFIWIKAPPRPACPAPNVSQTVEPMPSEKWPSRGLVEGPARAPARAMLHAAGYDEEALAKPMVAIVNS